MENNQSPKYRILAVDDEQDVVLFVKSTLGDQYEVITSNDPREALLKFQDCEPDLVLLDVMMPGMSGYDVCQAIRKIAGNSLPVIMLSALDTVDDHKSGYREGATYYLTKPISPERLLRNIEVQLAPLGKPRVKKMTLEQIKEKRYWMEPYSCPQENEVESANAQPARPRLLIVDDNDDVLRLMKALFDKDYELLVASDGVDALRKITAYEPDMMIVDIMLTRINGLQICSAIRKLEQFINTPILFYTTKDEPLVHDMAESYKAKILKKDSSYKELDKMVRDMISQSPSLKTQKRVAYSRISEMDRGVI